MILSIDTSTPICSVALHQEGKLVASTHLYMAKATASSLLLLIDQLLHCSHTPKTALQAIAVGKGPGSYTGLRIAVSTAKGISYTLGIPLIGIDSLQGMACAISKELPLGAKDLLLPMIDARRMEVYTAVYTSSLENLLPTEAHIVDETSFSSYLEEGKQLWLFGNGAEKVAQALGHEQTRLLNRPETAAIGIGYLAWERWQQQDFEDIAYFEPFYLKEFQGNKTKGHKLLRNLKETLPKADS